ncbi:MAG: two-component system, OmpR family, sensor kinase [Microbacteriaceae bacterium]|jgi:two-component system OmpR family sensor kinase|nr:two-component system, OmpR family, sensor kinase [Microbacteriaceae bacterium]
MTGASEAAPGAKLQWWRLGIRPFRTWTLLSRLVAAVVGLVAIVSIVIGLLSAIALNSYLSDQLNTQLGEALNRGQNTADRIFGSQPADSRVAGVVSAPGQPTGTFAAVIDSGGIYAQILGSGPEPTARAISQNIAAVAALPPNGEPRTVNLGQFGDYRIAMVPLLNGGTIAIGLPLSPVNATVSQIVFVILMVTIVGLAAAAALATLIVRLALRPLQRVANTAQQVSELPLERGDVALAVRVPEADTDPRTEVGTVGAALNRMLMHVGAALTARQASEQKVRQFVADASHELRTPLASIRGYAELTRRGPHELHTDVTHAIGRIESEATRMTSIVEDLLLLARLDEGRALERDPVDLSMMLIDAVSDAHAAGPNHRWSLDLPDEPVEVTGDAARLHQVIANLLANARVHTAEGTEVTAALAVEAERAVITVTDNGAGIPAELQQTLFERFVRGDSSRARATGSSGLGLAIVYAVVEAHGGTVSVESAPGQTVFRVSLPL